MDECCEASGSMCFAGDGVEGASEGDIVELEVKEDDKLIGPAIIKRFPFLTGCTALHLPQNFTCQLDKARHNVHMALYFAPIAIILSSA